ncbi:MAG: DEAD/DEAH box helicase [Thermodesulfobacteriota bacterium]|nr:DEAD/DEAH box helicase [Thermodesulfobacteriota bacterium]
MPFDLTIEEIRNRCGVTYYQRGLRYQREGRVLIAECDEANPSIYGEVRGSGRNIYTQEIYFSPTQHHRIRGFCTCPVTQNCKHVVAVLLEWIEMNLSIFEQRSEQQVSNLQSWKQETTMRLQQTTMVESPKRGDACLLYLLKPAQEGSIEVIEIETVKSRRLKRGGWGKPSYFDRDELSRYSYYGTPAVAQPLDTKIAQLLFDKKSYSSNLPRLEGDIGLLVLRRLLQSGRCFLQTPGNPPLSSGPKCKATFNWQTGDTTTKLVIGLENVSDDWLLLPTVPPWYLDIAHHRCGPIEQPLSPQLLASLITLPPVTADQLTDLSNFLLQKLPANSINLPVDLDITCINEPPVPTLQLYSIASATGVRHHLARLRFGYGDLSLPPHWLMGTEAELIRQNGTNWQVVRDLEAEGRALQELIQRQFTPASGEMSTPGELDLLFHVDSLTESALAWKELLDELPQLKANGWRVEIDQNFVLSFETATTLVADIDEEGRSDWFEIGLTIEHDGHKIALLPLLVQWLEGNEPEQPLLYLLEGNRWLEVPTSVLEPVVETLVELFQDPQFGASDRLKLPRAQAHSLLEIESRLGKSGNQLEWHGGKNLRQLAEKLNNFKGIQPVAAPDDLTAELRDYQLQGLAWLQFLREYHFNGILADDMGLGKTIQTLSHLLLEKAAGRLKQPVLIVAPTSVLSNWLREATRFTPTLKGLVLHGPSRTRHFDHLSEYDFIITSYALLTRDLDEHLKHSYHSLILDEAQAIKNPRAKSAQAACKIDCSHRLCLTGTPLENHLGELWSLFHFLMPGFLSQQKKFNQVFRTPIEKHHDSGRQQQLQQRISPFVLRRNKEQVARELPPKTVMIREAELKGAQARLYESLRLAMVQKVSRLLESKGLQRSHIEILDALLKLRQVCCDPRLVKLESAREIKTSAKLEVLLELVEKLLSEDRKILLFSQFTSMLSLIETELQNRNIGYTKLTGQTRKRDAVIATFQNGEVPVFLISLKAGGVGLNLTAADTVIHYDPWWNPAVENQATDRAHRIGQDKPVFVYKLIASGTVEEKILQLQEKKQQLANSVYQKGKDQEPLSRLKSEDILELLAPV